MHLVILMGIQLGQQSVLVEHLPILCATRQVCDAQLLLLPQLRLVWNLQTMQNELREGAEESTIRAALDLQEEEDNSTKVWGKFQLILTMGVL